ncbi:hypothetical protein V5O48_001578 [Marasmius crinis-equi]|uniref:F-box domain-containing protein n=1 Tax=Marasmius crinis-equi TaxID=585013 RepID=A0ABR3FY47_9AGAR
MELEGALQRISLTNLPNAADVQLVSSSLVRISAELEHLEAVTTRVHAQLAEAKAALNRLQKTLHSLDRKRDKLKETVHSSRRLLADVSSPGRRIPTEILQEIFRLGLHTFPVVHGSVAPLLYGQVCRQWREVAHATPELWANIHITIPLTVGPGDSEGVLFSRGASLLESVTSWLDRAWGRPLRISIFTKPPSWNQQLIGFLSRFLARIGAYFEKCTYLSMVVPFECLDFLPSIEAMPILERVNLSHSCMPAIFDPPASFDPDVLSGLIYAPRLQNLSLSSWPNEVFRPIAKWGGLRYLTLRITSDDTFGPSEALNILTECSRLQSFTLVMSCTRWRWADTTAWAVPLEMSALRELRMDIVFSNFLGTFLSNIRLPAIRQLEVGIQRTLDEDDACQLLLRLRQALQLHQDLDALQLTAKRSPGHIMSPRLRQFIYAFLGVVPALSHLTLDMGSKLIHEEVLTALSVVNPLPRHGGPCPRLTEVVLLDQNDSLGPPDNSVLEAFLLSRLSPHEPNIPLRRFISPLRPSASCMTALQEFDGRLEIGVPPIASDTITRPQHFNSPFACAPSSLETTDANPSS